MSSNKVTEPVGHTGLLRFLRAKFENKWVLFAGIAALYCVSFLRETTTGEMRINESSEGVKTIQLQSGGDLQHALRIANPGDTIELAAGAEFNGNFVLPAKPVLDTEDIQPWITIRSSEHHQLPGGERVAIADADHMPKIVSPNSDPAIATQFGAHHYHFVGVEITTTSTKNYNLVLLGYNGLEDSSAKTMDQLPYEIIVERCYIHGNPTGHIRRGIAMNARAFTIIDSYVSDFHEVGADSQALCAWNGAGPFKIVNNYLEGSGENVMFGGGDPSIPGLVPSDIEFRRNYVFKPRRWQIGHPTYAGIKWTVKNLFEIKNARRVTIEGNIFENCWAHAQAGVAIVLTPRNQGGRAPWSTLEDVTIENNIIRNASTGVMLLSQSKTGGRISRPSRNILIRGNLFENIGVRGNKGDGRMFEFLAQKNGIPSQDVIVENNTLLHGRGKALAIAGDSTTVAKNFVFQNNIVTCGTYGFTGSGTSPGLGSLNHYFEDWKFRGNLLIGKVNQPSYPKGSFFAPSIEQVGFTDYARGNYRLVAKSTWKNSGTDGRDPGVDMDVLTAATEGVELGVNSPRAVLSQVGQIGPTEALQR